MTDDEFLHAFTTTEFLGAFPIVLDKGLPFRRWSRLMSPQARAAWVDPDLQPLPAA